MPRRTSFADFLRDNPELKAKYDSWRKLYEKQFACIDCGDTFFHTYMVTGKVWEEAGLHHRALCCLQCLDRRLTERRGRGVEVEDFTAVKCNNVFIWLWEKVRKMGS